MKIEEVLDETDKENLSELLGDFKEKFYNLPLEIQKSEDKDAEHN
ncbi:MULTISPECIES: hypothetical protein [Clostridium]|nr:MULTISPECIES: hypothetical protein [Clostridium]